MDPILYFNASDWRHYICTPLRQLPKTCSPEPPTHKDWPTKLAEDFSVTGFALATKRMEKVWRGWFHNLDSCGWFQTKPNPGPQATGKSEASGSKGSTDRTAVFTSWHVDQQGKTHAGNHPSGRFFEVIAPTLTVPVPCFLCKIHTASFICGAYIHRAKQLSFNAFSVGSCKVRLSKMI